jgi:hypothetical protein
MAGGDEQQVAFPHLQCGHDAGPQRWHQQGEDKQECAHGARAAERAA